MRDALRALLHPDDLGEQQLGERLESFLRLALAQVTRGPRRTTDGAEHVRWVERGPSAFRLAGKVWELPGSTLQTFWLEASEHGAGGRLRWTLHYGVEARRPGRASPATPPSCSRRPQRSAGR